MSKRAKLAQEITEYLDEGWSCPPEAVRMMRAAAKLLVVDAPPVALPARTKRPQHRYRDEGGVYHYGVPNA